MITTQTVVLVCWIIFTLYWLISATSVKHTQETKGWLAGNWQRILLMVFATTLSFGTLSACIGFLVILLGIWFKLKEEEALLAERFPEEYSAYKNRTKILIPFLW